MTTSNTTPNAGAERDPRYPVGKFQPPATITPEQRREAVETIAALPEKLRNAVQGLTAAQIDTPYREGGWTVRQLIHHVADSHAQALMRLKWALTEDWPTVMGYNEKLWAELPDAKTAPIEWSLEIVEATHARWVLLLKTLGEAEWKRGFTHSERGRQSVEAVTLLYAWHSLHHTAHVTELRKAKGW
jgi:uncharacterized damage-inducible protein DinB